MSYVLSLFHLQDEHGQSVLHFAAARSHGRNALIQMIEDSGISIAFRDELYRTARDVSMQATQPENTREIDKYVLGLVARGKLRPFIIQPKYFLGDTLLTSWIIFEIGELLAIKHLLIEGYDHIIDIHDDSSVTEIAKARGHVELAEFLQNLPLFEVC